jgi:phospholipid/cholesterol/gamma-HCH transport system permease protein
MAFSLGRFFGKVGRETIRRVNHLLDLCAFAYRIVGLLVRRPTAGRRYLNRIIVEQIYFTAVQALYVVVPVALIIGTMVIIQFAQVSSEYDLGKITVILVVREFGPLITALVVILRSATAVTIETGYMKVLNEMESIEMAGIDPVHIICPPRLVGITSAILCLFVVFDLAAILGGYAVVWLMTDVPLSDFMDQIAKAMTEADLVVGIAKGIFFGIAITVATMYRGFSVQRSVTDIPVATSRAAVDCLFYCLVINIFVSAVIYM